ncbi:cytochrome b5 domain-containing protein 1 [Thalassophryne amazonica]|uniref:cytochrome b5 domain-containing protein 1 n=1 Tax=Thalassophryne amazonica TaxID=390379 RepID=UPI001470C4FB|nr:cytochrome b5 domain-containing protein 1 [Thalassophryne amazonica]
MDRPRYFTPAEVAAHNVGEDLWVSFLGKVWNLTPLIDLYKGDALLLPIMECAGKDISYWFDPETQDIRMHIDPISNCLRYCTPRGRFVHVPPVGPRTDWNCDFGLPWWKDKRYQVGVLSSKTRWIRIVNTLVSQEQQLEVCSEETLADIFQLYLRYNAHAASYTWKYNGVQLDMSRTLSQNGIHDEEEELDHDLFTPAILLYFNDDLSEA